MINGPFQSLLLTCGSAEFDSGCFIFLNVHSISVFILSASRLSTLGLSLLYFSITLQVLSLKRMTLNTWPSLLLLFQLTSQYMQGHSQTLNLDNWGILWSTFNPNYNALPQILYLLSFTY